MKRLEIKKCVVVWDNEHRQHVVIEEGAKVCVLDLKGNERIGVLKDMYKNSVIIRTHQGEISMPLHFIDYIWEVD